MLQGPKTNANAQRFLGRFHNTLQIQVCSITLRHSKDTSSLHSCGNGIDMNHGKAAGYTGFYNEVDVVLESAYRLSARAAGSTNCCFIKCCGPQTNVR